ncbi:MAG: hypothetical protein RL768_1359 [Nitrospirota bacterium]|jgi:uncharacterized flavoprotein (TIGR03862 family)
MKTLAIIGGGPAGLMAAEAASAAGVRVDLYDSMPSVGRKFLLAGKGGLNLTHSEPLERMLGRYGARRPQIEPLLKVFPPDKLLAWARGLGVETFVGSSGRVFPKDMKAAPLLRAWLRRLRQSGVSFHVRHRWQGWSDDGTLRFETPTGEQFVRADAVILALGGASWPQLGSDAAWVRWVMGRGVKIAPLRPANCGFDVAWTPVMRQKFAGHPVKSVAMKLPTPSGGERWKQGEFVVTETGVEGGVVYAFSSALRDAIEKKGTVTVYLDLTPDRDRARLEQDLARPREKRTMATHLERRVGISGVKAGLLRELVSKEDFADPVKLAAAIKSLPVILTAARPIAEAISTAGGVMFESLDARLMLSRIPGVFCAGEMLDWEAPTGGYLLTACFASGRVAGAGAAAWLKPKRT